MRSIADYYDVRATIGTVGWALLVNLFAAADPEGKIQRNLLELTRMADATAWRIGELLDELSARGVISFTRSGNNFEIAFT